MSPMSTNPPRCGRRALLVAAALAAAALPVPAGSAPAPAPANAERAGTLRVASWNIAWLGARGGTGSVPRTQADYDRLRVYAERLDADVVALQEIDGAAAARRVFDPDRYAFLFAAGGGSAQRAGFAWKKSLRVTPHADVVALALDGRSRRGADITVHAPLGDLRLLSIHLKRGCASGRLDGPDEACAMLREQSRRLEEWIDTRAGEGIAFAVLGDFNRRFTANDPFWLGIDDAEPPEADLTDAGFGRRPPCWGGRYRQYIDHIVLSRTASAWLLPNSFFQQVYDPSDEGRMEALSDHCPIAAVLDPSRRPIAPKP
jgi:endonuclease/exonuclease/phosphatase family metal-dependent hydrolase